MDFENSQKINENRNNDNFFVVRTTGRFVKKTLGGQLHFNTCRVQNGENQ